MTNRKLHTRFRLVPKSSTFDDLERNALCASRDTATISRPSVCLSVRDVEVPWS